MVTTKTSWHSARRNVRLARSRALRMVPASGMVEELVRNVSGLRGRTVQLLPFDMGPRSPSGFWIATDRADYVVFPADASSAERTAVICHELAHMLLNHQPQAKAERLTQMAELVAPDVDSDVARRFLGRHGYLDTMEAEAERLGTVLVTRLARNAEAHAVRRDTVSDRLR